MNTVKACAAALYELAREDGKAGAVAEEMCIIGACLKETPEYMRLLDAVKITQNQKTQLIEAGFGTAHPYIGNLLKMLAERRQAYLFPGCVSEYMRIYENAQGIVRAQITLPYPAGDKTLEDIRSRLCRLSGKNVVLELKIDPELIGGMVLEMEGRRFDNSIRTKLGNIGAVMAGNMAEG